MLSTSPSGLMSRTSPTKLTMAPTLLLLARSAATSAFRSKSSCCICTLISASRDGGEDGDFITILDWRGRVAEFLVHRTAHALLGKFAFPSFAAAAQPCQQLAQRLQRVRRLHGFARQLEVLAGAAKIEQFDFHDG